MLQHDASGGKKVHPRCQNTTPVGASKRGLCLCKGGSRLCWKWVSEALSDPLCGSGHRPRPLGADVGASVGLAGLSAPRRSTVSASRFSCPLRGLFRPGSWSLFLSTSCASLGARSAPSWTLRAVGLVADEKRPVRGRTLAPVLLGLGTQTIPCTPEQEHVSWGTRP